MNVLSLGPLNSLLYLLAHSPCISRFPDFGPDFHKKVYTKKGPCLFPFLFPFIVITKEQTHFQRTQGAEAVIAVSSVLM